MMKPEKDRGISKDVLRTRINGVIEAIIPKNRKQLFLWYTILFVVVLIGSYLPFLVLDRTLIWEKDDGFLQHYEWIVYLKRAIGQFLSGDGFSFWSWSLGLGADTIGFIGGILFDPFNYFAALFPESHIDIGYTFAIFLRLYVAGIGFLWFAKITGLRYNTSLIGALTYSFSSWVFHFTTTQDTFVTAAVMFVFLMVGVEKILRRQSPLPFLVAAFFSAVTSIYFSYMSTVLIFVYLLIHFIKNEKRSVSNFLKFVGRFLIYAGIVFLLVMIVFLPVMYTLSNSVRSGAAQYGIFHRLSTYANYISTFAAGNMIFQHGSTFGAFSLFLILIPPIFSNIFRRKASAAMVMFLCCLIFLAFPVVNSVFNGMGYPAGRWCYGATFFFVWSGVQCLDGSYGDIIRLKKSIYGFLAFLGIWLVIICRVILQIQSEYILVLGIINIAGGFLIYNIIDSIYHTKRKKNGYVLLTMFVMLNLMVYHTVENVPSFSQLIFWQAQQGSVHNKLSHSTQKAATEIEDNAFYRVDQADYIQPGQEAPDHYINKPNRYVHTPANETLVFNTRSLYSYHSVIPDHTYKLNREVCNNASYYRRICAYNNDNRARLDFLTGVKYFLGNNPTNYPPTGADEYAGYGFSFSKKSSGGVNILKSNYALGLGCVFDSYITKDEWLSLNYMDREQALLDCVVLSDSFKENGLLHKSVEEISSGAAELPYHLIKPIYLSGVNGSAFSETDLLTSKKFKVNQINGGFSINIDAEMNDSEIYVMFKNLKRIPENAITDTDSKLKYIREVMSAGKDYGEFDVFLGNGVISRRLLNTIGSDQGLSDITDFTTNMGVQNKGSKEIKVTFDHAGTYTFDDLQIVAVPLSTFRESASVCMQNSFTTEIISDNYICGKANTKKSKSMLYLSVPYYKGWRAYVDGRETEIQQIDTAYSGIPITGEGEHKIELKYRPVGFEVGVITFVLGVMATILVSVLYSRKKKELLKG